MVGDVEGGVVALHPRRSHGLPVPQGADLLPVALLDWDVGPVGAGPVDGGGGAQHIEGDAVVPGQNGHSAGADLVGRVPVGGHPVAAHKTGLNRAVFHHHGGHIVTDEGHIHPRLLKLPGGEPGPLEEGPGLVGKHVQGDSPLVSQKDGTKGGAVFRGGKGSRITVGQHPVPRLQEGQAVLGDFLAHLLVLPADGPGLLPQGGDDLLHRRTGHPDGQMGEPSHRPGQVYRCGPGADKHFSLSVQLIQKGGAG